MKVGLLLAAGRSERFGTRDKLLAEVKGQPMVAHAASVLRRLSLDRLIAVTSSPAVAAELSGFRIVHNPSPDTGQGPSLAMGVDAASSLKTTRLLVMLADMPFVSIDHARAVLERCTDERAAASIANGQVSPPACFPARDIARLVAISGDQGARKLIAGLPADALVEAAADQLSDIDTEEALGAVS